MSVSDTNKESENQYLLQNTQGNSAFLHCILSHKNRWAAKIVPPSTVQENLVRTEKLNGTEIYGFGHSDIHQRWTERRKQVHPWNWRGKSGSLHANEIIRCMLTATQNFLSTARTKICMFFSYPKTNDMLLMLATKQEKCL